MTQEVKDFGNSTHPILRDQDYINIIKNTIQINLQRYAAPNQDLLNVEMKFNISDQLFFETLKMEIRKSTIQFASKKKDKLIYSKIN